MGVSNTASNEEIIYAYKKKIFMCHTGKGSFYIHKPENKSNKEYENELLEALNILTNKYYKKIYDNYGYDKIQKLIKENNVNRENMDHYANIFLEFKK